MKKNAIFWQILKDIWKKIWIVNLKELSGTFPQEPKYIIQSNESTERINLKEQSSVFPAYKMMFNV